MTKIIIPYEDHPSIRLTLNMQLCTAYWWKSKPPMTHCAYQLVKKWGGWKNIISEINKLSRNLHVHVHRDGMQFERDTYMEFISRSIQINCLLTFDSTFSWYELFQFVLQFIDSIWRISDHINLKFSLISPCCPIYLLCQKAVRCFFLEWHAS